MNGPPLLDEESRKACEEYVIKARKLVARIFRVQRPTKRVIFFFLIMPIAVALWSVHN